MQCRLTSCTDNAVLLYKIIDERGVAYDGKKSAVFLLCLLYLYALLVPCINLLLTIRSIILFATRTRTPVSGRLTASLPAVASKEHRIGLVDMHKVGSVGSDWPDIEKDKRLDIERL